MKTIQKIVLLVLIVNFATQLTAQDIMPYNKALIWRGFEHNWTYNHRINRLGSYVSLQEGIGKTVHTSASGLGSDSTFARTHYSYVESPNVFFTEKEIKIFITGKEGELLTQIQQEYVDLEEWMKNKDEYEVLLNGFEIKSVKKADQLQLFRFLLDPAVYNEETQKMQLTAHFNLVTNCRTLECEVLSDITAYELTLKVLIIGYNNHDVNVTSAYASRNYVWDTKVEVEELNKNVSIGGQRNDFPIACVGLKGMGFILDEEHWMLEMNSFVTPLNYNSKTGTLNSQVNMKFVEWRSKMNIFSISPFKSKFAKRKSGFALLDSNVSMLQFTNAKVKHGVEESSSYWKGNNLNAASNEANATKNITPYLNFK